MTGSRSTPAPPREDRDHRAGTTVEAGVEDGKPASGRGGSESSPEDDPSAIDLETVRDRAS